MLLTSTKKTFLFLKAFLQSQTLHDSFVFYTNIISLHISCKDSILHICKQVLDYPKILYPISLPCKMTPFVVY